MELNQSILLDPILFAEWATETYLIPTYTLDVPSLLPSEEEIQVWDISDREIALCRCELALMAASGVAVTVTKNMPFEFYNAFVNALSGRLVKMLYGHYSASFVKDARDNIELYICYLEGQSMYEFSSHYMRRIFGSNPKISEMTFVKNLWQRPADVLLQTLGASREAIVNFLAAS